MTSEASVAARAVHLSDLLGIELALMSMVSSVSSLHTAMGCLLSMDFSGKDIMVREPELGHSCRTEEYSNGASLLRCSLTTWRRILLVAIQSEGLARNIPSISVFLQEVIDAMQCTLFFTRVFLPRNLCTSNCFGICFLDMTNCYDH